MGRSLFITPNENEELFFGRIKDNGLIYISIEKGKDEDSEIAEIFINKEQAEQIIEHLQEQFNLKKATT